MDKIWLSTPHFSGKEMALIKPVLSGETSLVTQSVTDFEAALSAYFGVPDAAALSSGTAAIHLALKMLGVQAGDEVLCSSFTFVGSANPIVYLGAEPLFVDCEPDTWNICPEAMEHGIKHRLQWGKKPKAAVIVHGYGMPAQIERLIEVCNRYQIPVVEDAAEAFGSRYNDKLLGTFGDIGIFSFNVNKIITTMGGGALIAKNNDWVQQARMLANQARDPAPHYQHSKIGYNYRLSGINASIGLAQLEVIDQRVASRRANFAFYKNALGNEPAIHFLDENSGVSAQNNAFSNYWLTSFWLNHPRITAETLRQTLLEAGIEARPLWKPLHKQPIFAHNHYYGSGLSEQYFSNGLSLPSSSNLSEKELQRVCTLILDTLQKA